MKYIVTLAASITLAAFGSATTLGGPLGTVTGTVNAQANVPPVALPRIPSLPPMPPPHPQKPDAPNGVAQAQLVDATSLSIDSRPYQATLSGINGSAIQVQFGGGVTESFAVDANADAALSAQVGKPIAFRLVKGALQVADDAKWATLEAVKGGVATLRDAENRSVNYNVSAETAAQLQGSVGKKIAYVASGNAIVLASNQAPPSNRKR
ncbi:MAG TPA: hypothetical protein VNF68_05240 [Candidatus Baltobacteraceae bacterium]|nr:hypothetical protein [Candidatus Baltobacteraceae bacterium]